MATKQNIQTGTGINPLATANDQYISALLKKTGVNVTQKTVDNWKKKYPNW